jgi:hypothetical protein
MNAQQNEPARIGDRVTRALDNPWVVLVLLFFVFAALGIPLIWISRAFSTWSKVLLTILVTLYTFLLLWLFYLVMVWSYNRIVDSL